MGSWLRRIFGTADAARPVSAPSPDAAEHARAPLAVPAFDVDAAFHRWLLDAGTGSSDGPRDDVEQALYDALQNALADPRLATRVPRVPSIVPQLLHMLRDPSHDASEVAEQLAHDPVLVAAVLRVANSPWYGARRRIKSLDHAVLILGQDGLRQLVASVAMKPLINVQSGRFTRTAAPRVWEQSERGCAACRMLARDRPASAFEAYLAVLLVNMGTIVALRVMDEHPRKGAAPGSIAFCEALGSVVRHLAATIGRQWEFPPSVVGALRPQATSSPAPLVRAAETVSRVRVLVDAGRVSEQDGKRALGEAPAVIACFEALALAA